MPTKLIILLFLGSGEREDQENRGKKIIDSILATIAKQNANYAQYIHFAYVDYHSGFDAVQRENLQRIESSVLGKIRGFLRKFIYFNIADNFTYTYEKENPQGAYQSIQRSICEQLTDLEQDLGGADAPVMLLASSFGTQVVHDYILDQQRYMHFWKEGLPGGKLAQLKQLRVLITCGTTIALHYSGISAARTFRKPHPSFEWFNFFDQQDSMGWPLATLSGTGGGDAAALAQGLFQDVLSEEKIVKAGPFWGKGLLGLTPATHFSYWKNKTVLNKIVEKVDEILKEELTRPIEGPSV